MRSIPDTDDFFSIGHLSKTWRGRVGRQHFTRDTQQPHIYTSIYIQASIIPERLAWMRQGAASRQPWGETRAPSARAAEVRSGTRRATRRQPFARFMKRLNQRISNKRDAREGGERGRGTRETRRRARDTNDKPSTAIQAGRLHARQERNSLTALQARRAASTKV